MATLLKWARKRRRLTQAELADLAGIVRLTVSKAEAGLPCLGLSTFLELLMMLDPNRLQSVLLAVRSDEVGESLELSRLAERVVPSDDL